MNGIDKCQIHNICDEQGNPSGGSVHGVGLDINWQNGPLGVGRERKDPNGAFVETVISAAKQRLEYFQESKYACRENELAINYLSRALGILEQRTTDRQKRNVEGTHNV